MGLVYHNQVFSIYLSALRANEKEDNTQGLLGNIALVTPFKRLLIHNRNAN